MDTAGKTISVLSTKLVEIYRLYTSFPVPRDNKVEELVDTANKLVFQPDQLSIENNSQAQESSLEKIKQELERQRQYLHDKILFKLYMKTVPLSSAQYSHDDPQTLSISESVHKYWQKEASCDELHSVIHDLEQIINNANQSTKEKIIESLQSKQIYNQDDIDHFKKYNKKRLITKLQTYKEQLTQMLTEVSNRVQVKQDLEDLYRLSYGNQRYSPEGKALDQAISSTQDINSESMKKNLAEWEESFSRQMRSYLGISIVFIRENVLLKGNEKWENILDESLVKWLDDMRSFITQDNINDPINIHGDTCLHVALKIAKMLNNPSQNPAHEQQLINDSLADIFKGDDQQKTTLQELYSQGIQNPQIMQQQFREIITKLSAILKNTPQKKQHKIKNIQNLIIQLNTPLVREANKNLINHLFTIPDITLSATNNNKNTPLFIFIHKIKKFDHDNQGILDKLLQRVDVDHELWIKHEKYHGAMAACSSALIIEGIILTAACVAIYMKANHLFKQCPIWGWVVLADCLLAIVLVSGGIGYYCSGKRSLDHLDTLRENVNEASTDMTNVSTHCQQNITK